MCPPGPRMTSELTSRDEGRQALAITAEWSEVAADYDDTLAEYGKVEVPGFRPGRAPRAAVEQRFRRQIRDDFASRCGRRLTRQALDERGLRAAAPIAVVSIELEPRCSFSFTAEFTPLPQLELPDYTQLELDGAADDERRDEASEWLLAHTPGEIPAALVRQECERGEAGSADPGGEAWRAAARRVKLLAILDQIAEEEGIHVDDRDVDARIARMAAECGMRADELHRKLEREDGLTRLESLLRAEQTLGYLLARAAPNNGRENR